MKLAILLDSHKISGGVYTIFEHAVRAMKQGIQVEIVTENEVPINELDWHPDAKELIWKTYSQCNEVYDAVMATWWQTAYKLFRIKGKHYIYFVQSIESRFYSDDKTLLRNMADATYMLPVTVITEASWIQNFLFDQFGKNAFKVRNGIRKDLYRVDGEAIKPKDPDKLRVLIEGPVNKGFKNIPETITCCRQSDADEVWLLTSSPDSMCENLDVDVVFSQVPIFETPKIYRSCDVVVKLSFVEGMFAPPLEMFHCGGTSVVYEVTGCHEYMVNDVNSVIAPKGDGEAIVKILNKLKHNRDYLNRLTNEARKTADSWPDWKVSSNQFFNTVLAICMTADERTEPLKQYTNILMNMYNIGDNYWNQLKKETRLMA